MSFFGLRFLSCKTEGMIYMLKKIFYNSSIRQTTTLWSGRSMKTSLGHGCGVLSHSHPKWIQQIRNGHIGDTLASSSL